MDAIYVKSTPNQFFVTSLYKTKDDYSLDGVHSVGNIEEYFRYVLSAIDLNDFSSIVNASSFFFKISVDSYGEQLHKSLWGDPKKPLLDATNRTTNPGSLALLHALLVRYGRYQSEIQKLEYLLQQEQRDPGSVSRDNYGQLLMIGQTNSRIDFLSQAFQDYKQNPNLARRKLEIYHATNSMLLRSVVLSSLSDIGKYPDHKDFVRRVLVDPDLLKLGGGMRFVGLVRIWLGRHDLYENRENYSNEELVEILIRDLDSRG